MLELLELSVKIWRIIILCGKEVLADQATVLLSEPGMACLFLLENCIVTGFQLEVRRHTFIKIAQRTKTG